MAKRTHIPYRYATAWLDAAEERGVLPQVRADIDGLEELLTASEDLRAFLQDRGLRPKDKQDFLTRLFQGKVQEITLNFLLLLTVRQREPLLADTIEACHALLDERDGVMNAEVASAVALTGKQIDSLKAKLESYTGKHMRMRTSVEPDLLGGFVVHVGDVVFDSSLRVQLQRVKQALTGR